MDMISAYREVGTYRGAAAISGATPKTVQRVIARHESGEARPVRTPRKHNDDEVVELVSERVEKTKGKITAKRLLPVAQAAGYAGSARNFRRLVSGQKALWRKENHHCRRPAVWSPGEHLLADFSDGRSAQPAPGTGQVDTDRGERPDVAAGPPRIDHAVNGRERAGGGVEVLRGVVRHVQRVQRMATTRVDPVEQHGERHPVRPDRVRPVQQLDRDRDPVDVDRRR